jgi:uncharacterized protein YycO
MKKSLALFTSVIFLLYGCSNEFSDPSFSQLQPVPQVETVTAQDYEAESIANSNKDSIAAVAETIFAQNFADDLYVPPSNKITPVNVTQNLQQKGGMLYSILSKSKLAQKVGYLVADYPIRAKFNQKSKPDNIPNINEQQISELKSVLKPGDIILCGNNGSFIHSILYLGNDVIVHALATKGEGKTFTGTIKETLSEYLFRAHRDKFVVLRYKNLDPNELTKVFDYASKQVGKSYDSLFLMNSDTRFYCTELVYQSLMQMNNPPRMIPHKASMGWQLITNEDFMDSPDFETIWTFNKIRPPVATLHTY